MRLLILAYDFPPNTSVGAQRPYGWFRYLKEFGIHPVVVTRHWDEVRTTEDTIRPCGNEVTVTETHEGTIIRVPYRPNLRDRMLLRFGERFSLFRRALSLWLTLAQYFIRWSDNRYNICEAAREHLRNSPCDAIIATGEPFVLFSYAKKLSEEFGIPWVGDYRDGWSRNYHYMSAGSPADRLIHCRLMGLIESAMVKDSALLTTATPVLSAEVQAFHAKKQVKTVLNGFLPDAYVGLPVAERPGSRFVMVYLGSLYMFQKLEIFLDGLLLTVEKEKLTSEDLCLLFIGVEFQSEALARLLDHDDRLRPFIRTTGRTPLREALAHVREADAALLLASTSYLPIAAKLYDYIALGKPVLVCPNDRGPVEQILRETGTGIFADTPEEVCAAITALMNGPGITDRQNPEVRDRFSRRHQTGILARLLKDITTK